MTIQDTEDFDRRLGDSLEALISCQRNKNIASCFKCSQLLVCDVRKQYVKEVYISMNPNMEDRTNGFEF